MAGIMRVTVDGVGHELNLEKLTFGEARAYERVTGEAASAIGKKVDDGTEDGASYVPSLSAMQAFAWLAMKRDNTRMVFGDLDDVAITDVAYEMVGDEPDADAEPDPTEATDAP